MWKAMYEVEILTLKLAYIFVTKTVNTGIKINLENILVLTNFGSKNGKMVGQRQFFLAMASVFVHR